MSKNIKDKEFSSNIRYPKIPFVKIHANLWLTFLATDECRFTRIKNICVNRRHLRMIHSHALAGSWSRLLCRFEAADGVAFGVGDDEAAVGGLELDLFVAAFEVARGRTGGHRFA